MILIPFSRVCYKTKHSIDEIKKLLSKETGIQIDQSKSSIKSTFFRKYKGQITGDTFELIEKSVGPDAWTLRITGKLSQENDSTKVETSVVFNFSAWILFIMVFLLSIGSAGGFYLKYKFSGELNPAFWGIIKMNLSFYFIYLIAYHVKKFRNDRFLIRILNAVKV